MVDMDVTDKDYYSILGLDRDADGHAIKAAFRRQARRYHPDVNHGDATTERRFKDVNEAYQTLVDPVRRGYYDAVCGAASARLSSVQNQDAASSRPAAGALRRLWWEERAAVAYTARWARAAITRLGVRTRIAVIAGSLLLCLLARQLLGLSSAHPRPTATVGVTDKTNAAHVTTTTTASGPRGQGPSHARTTRPPARSARSAPTYLFGGCLRHCSPGAPARGVRPTGALSRAPHLRSAPHPLYLYNGCIRHCPSTRLEDRWRHKG